jgi:hypothetical protein
MSEEQEKRAKRMKKYEDEEARHCQRKQEESLSTALKVWKDEKVAVISTSYHKSQATQRRVKREKLESDIRQKYNIKSDADSASSSSNSNVHNNNNNNNSSGSSSSWWPFGTSKDNNDDDDDEPLCQLKCAVCQMTLRIENVDEHSLECSPAKHELPDDVHLNKSKLSGRAKTHVHHHAKSWQEQREEAERAHANSSASEASSSGSQLKATTKKKKKIKK